MLVLHVSVQVTECTIDALEQTSLRGPPHTHTRKRKYATTSNISVFPCSKEKQQDPKVSADM